MGGTLPDLFYVRSFDAAPFGARGWIHPLNELMERDGMDFSDFWPAQVAQNSYQGQLMTLPYDFLQRGHLLQQDHDSMKWACPTRPTTGPGTTALRSRPPSKMASRAIRPVGAWNCGPGPG